MLAGVAAAVLLGVAFAMLMRPDLDRTNEGAERPVAQAVAPEGQAFDIRAAREAYRPPDRDAIAQAYAQAGRVFSAQGVSGLARYGLECFRALEKSTTYRQLDYCLAFDAFGAAINQRVSGGQPAPPDSYFGQSSSRNLAVAEAAIGGEGDASARLTDIRRIAIEVARLSGPAVQSAQAAAPQPPAAQAPSEAPSAEMGEAAPAVTPQAPAAQASATPPARPVTPQPAARPAPAQAPVRAQAQVQAPAPARAGPTAQEVAAARPARSSGPSFNCRYARTPAERMVCSRPELAEADRRLSAAYEDAIASGANRSALRLEQDRWLAIREGAAPDPAAVRDVYERRIRELRQAE